ncbi:MAG TPA: TonB-dependent receptor, partial [Bryobacteraceae bacterium]|nr:TonB-dependent receptor [Bryobacteraceae bacterium]
PAMYGGDFSGWKNAQGTMVPIYDPLTQCGKFANAACAKDANGNPVTIQRTQFPGNIIPSSRINPVAAKFATFPILAAPNQPGALNTAIGNFTKNISSGGDNDQVNGRFDYTMTEKLRLFGRFTRWNSANTPFDPFGNGIYGGDPYSPETFVTDNAVVGGTWLPSPSVVFDLRASYGRWNYLRIQPYTGINMNKTFGFPTYMDTQLPLIHGIANETSVPSMSIGNYTALPGQPGYSNSKIFSIDNDYVLLPTLSWVHGRHTFKFGADFRDMQNNYYQAPGGGSMTFNNLFTSQNALSAGASGNGLASMMLGYGNAGTALSFALPWQSLNYQGYFAQDTWQVTTKLTVTAGVRWEIPGVYKERYNRGVSFDPHEVNPTLQQLGINVNGQTVMGALDFINTPQHPFQGLKEEHFKLFAPRLGIAYRLNDKTVIRTGGGIYYLPANLQFNEGPYGNALNQFTNQWLVTLDSSVSPLYTMDNPYPNGFIPSLGNLPKDQAQKLIIGFSPSAQLGATPHAYNEQWNFTVQRQAPAGVAVEAAYAGSHGLHLPRGSWQADALPTQYLSLGTSLNDQVPNPFFGLVTVGNLSQSTVARGQLLLPFPQYTGVSEQGGYLGNATYHSLQMKVEKRFSEGGTVLAAYTFSKLIGDVESLTAWLDTGVGGTSLQDPNNLKVEKALSGFDSHRRLTLSYALDIPIGKGKAFLNGGPVIAQKFVSGWTVSGTSTFQDGFPLALTATPNVTGFNLGLRPNVVNGCDPNVSGSAQSKLLGWFNKSCFTVPAAYTLGNEARTDSRLRGHGIANYNFSAAKRTDITERFKLEFRAEFFNIFNRVQFAQPDRTITTAANPTTGYITSQLNNPRTVQLAMRLSF